MQVYCENIMDITIETMGADITLKDVEMTDMVNSLCEAAGSRSGRIEMLRYMAEWVEEMDQDNWPEFQKAMRSLAEDEPALPRGHCYYGEPPAEKIGLCHKCKHCLTADMHPGDDTRNDRMIVGCELKGTSDNCPLIPEHQERRARACIEQGFLLDRLRDEVAASHINRRQGKH